MVSKNLLRLIGKQVSIARLRAKLSRDKLNDKCEFYPGTEGIDNWITKIEQGEKNVSIEDLERIAAACGHKVEIKLVSLRLKQEFPVLTEDERLGSQFERLRAMGKI